VNLYVAFPSIITAAVGEVSIKNFEGINVKVVQQAVDFKQESSKAIFVTKENDYYVGIKELGDDSIIYDAKLLDNKGLIEKDLNKKYINVINGDIALVSELDFISKLGRLTLKDKLIYLKHPFLKGTTELKQEYLDMQLRLKDTYTKEELEEIIYCIGHLNHQPKQKQKQYLVHFRDEDYVLSRPGFKSKKMKHIL